MLLGKLLVEYGMVIETHNNFDADMLIDFIALYKPGTIFKLYFNDRLFVTMARE